jgi:hypothetical protein
MPLYQYNNKYYNVPDSESKAFLKRKPGAILIPDRNAPLTRFDQGVKQGWNQMMGGLKVVVGETDANRAANWSKASELLENEKDSLNTYDYKKAWQKNRQQKVKEYSAAVKEEREKAKAEGRKFKEIEKVSQLAKIIQPNFPTPEEYLLLEKALKDSGGDYEKTKNYIQQKAATPTFGDKWIQEGSAQIEKNSRKTTGAAWAGNFIPQMAIPAAAMAMSIFPQTRAASKQVGKIGMGILAASEAGGAMADAEKYAAMNPDENVTRDDILLSGALAASTEVLTEYIPFRRYMTLSKATQKRIGKEVSKGVLKNTIENKAAKKELNKAFENARKSLTGAKGMAVNYGKDITAEAMSEFSAEAIGTLIPTIYANQKDYPAISDILKNGWEGAKGGVFMGVFLGGASTAIRNAGNNARRRQQGVVTLAETKDGIFELIGEKQDTFTAMDSSGEIKDIPKPNVLNVQEYSPEEFKNGIKQHERDRTQEAAAEIEKEALRKANKSTGTLMSAKIAGKEYRVKEGKIVKDENGNIDYTRSDKQIYIDEIDDAGNVTTKVIPIQSVESITNDIPVKKVVTQAFDKMKQQDDALEKEMDSMDAQNFKAGDRVYIDPLGNGIAELVTITSVNDDGTYGVKDDDGREDVIPSTKTKNPENFRPIDNGDQVAYSDNEGKRKTGTVTDAYGLRGQDGGGMIAVGNDVVPLTNIIGRIEPKTPSPKPPWNK